MEATRKTGYHGYNESALIKEPHEYVQGYNRLAVVDSANLGNPSDAGGGKRPPETEFFKEMLDGIESAMETPAGEEDPIKT